MKKSLLYFEKFHPVLKHITKRVKALSRIVCPTSPAHATLTVPTTLVTAAY